LQRTGFRLTDKGLKMKSKSQEAELSWPARYEIKVKGQLDENWSDWLTGLDIEFDANETDAPVTTLSGTIVDQAALLGLLRTLHNMHLTVLSINRIKK
jgi:hypothetical protein